VISDRYFEIAGSTIEHMRNALVAQLDPLVVGAGPYTMPAQVTQFERRVGNWVFSPA